MDVDDDVAAHEVGYGIAEAVFVMQDGGAVEVTFTSQARRRPAFNKGLYYRLVTL